MAITLKIPLVPEMIHRPDNAAHMMRVKPAGRPLTVRFGDEVLARSTDALLLIEIGKDVYDPTYYVPLGDVDASLLPSSLTTHCPLKGDTEYRDLAATGDRPSVENIGWIYGRPKPEAEMLAGHIAFDPRKTRIVLDAT